MPVDIPEEARSLLTRDRNVAFLGTCHNEDPHVAPLWYNFYENAIEIATTGRKLENIRENPHVALAIQEDVDGKPKWGIVVQGTAEIVEEADDARALLRRLNRRYQVEQDAWSENTAVRIHIGSIEHWTY